MPRWVVAADGAVAAAQSSARLLLDPSDGRLWVIERGVRPARLLEFDAATLRPTRDVTVDVAIRDAAVMYGHLYLASSAGLDDLVLGALAWRPAPAPCWCSGARRRRR